jgi:hypothetical protein
MKTILATSLSFAFILARADNGTPGDVFTSKGSLRKDPLTHSNLVARVASTIQISLSWENRSNDELHFVIARKTGNSEFQEIGTVKKNVTVFSDVGLALMTSYTYRLMARNNVGSMLMGKPNTSFNDRSPQGRGTPYIKQGFRLALQVLPTSA